MTGRPQFSDHPDREALQAEAHSRPPMPIEHDDAEVWHWVLTDWPEGAVWPSPIEPSGRHQLIEVPDGVLRVERHTEFMALTFKGRGAPGEEATRIVQACPGTLLTGLHITLRPERDPTFLRQVFGEARLFGGLVNRGRVEAATDFRIGPDGLVRYVVAGAFEYSGSRGRTVKRLIDLETYRMASLLALPLVRRAYPRLEKLERGASDATRMLSAPDDETLGPTIDRLALELAEIGEMRDSLRYRIAASAAYHDIVERRLEILAEEPVGERQTLTGFVEHRLFPAINTVFAFDRRLDEVQRTVQSAMELARTRIDRHMETQNQSLLASMERRAGQQVHLAQAVEGLSTAAITYYAVGLFSYLIKALPEPGISHTKLTALSIPVIGGIVWFLARRARREAEKLFGDS